MLPARVGRASDKSASDVNNSISCFVTRKMNSYPFALFCHALYLAGSRVIFLRRVCVVILSLSLSLSIYIYILYLIILLPINRARATCTRAKWKLSMANHDGELRLLHRRLRIRGERERAFRGEEGTTHRGGIAIFTSTAIINMAPHVLRYSVVAVVARDNGSSTFFFFFFFFTPSFPALNAGFGVQGERGILTGEIDGWAAVHISRRAIDSPPLPSPPLPLPRDAVGK